MRRLAQFAPLALVLLAAGLRFHLIDQQSLWNDEGNTLRLVQRAIPELLAAAAQDIHPPGYYLALKAWYALTGDSEFALRAFSALAGVLTVAVVYALGKRLFAPGVGLIAAALVAVNSFAVYYSQEARMYALLALIAAASLLALVTWLDRPGWRTGIGLAVLNTLGLYTHYTFPAVLVTQGLLFVAFLVRPTRSRAALLGRYVVLNLGTLALFAPILPIAIHQVSGWPRTGQPVDAGSGVATVARWLIYGNTSLAGEGWLYFWPLLFVAAAFLPDWLRRRQPFAWRLAVPWLWLVVTLGPFFALGLFREANLKFLLPSQIALALLIARGAWLLWELGSPNLFILLEAAPRFLAGFGLLSMAMIASDALDNLYHVQAFARDDYRLMAQVIRAQGRPGDGIVLDAPNQQEVFSYYYPDVPGALPIYPLPKGLGGDDAATRTSIRQVIHDSRHVFVLFWGDNERDPERVVETELNAAAYPVWSRWYGKVRLALYTIPDAPASAPNRVLDADFGGLIRLRGVSLSSLDQVQPGDVIGLSLFWEAEKAIPKRYKVFVQLLDESGRLVAQRDSEPDNGLSLTTTWQVGQTVSDAHGLLVPPTLSPGKYTLILGLYDINDPSARLPVGGADHLDLAAITVGKG